MQMTQRISEKELLVPLTEHEKNIEVKNLTDFIQTREDLEAKVQGLKEQIKTLNQQIDIASEEIKDSSWTIRNGKYMPVQCQTRFDWENGTATVIRMDTYEVVEDRRINEHDKPMVTDTTVNEMALS